MKEMSQKKAYTLKRSRRAKYMRLSVRPGGHVVVTVPHLMGATAIEQFLMQHSRWIAKSVAKMAHLKPLPVSGRRAYLGYKEKARSFVYQRISYWNQIYNFSYNRISIKDTSSLWGSCSRRGNLNFSYKIIFLPRELADYVIVHELCHLKEHNHGARFWQLVAATQPAYARQRRELKKYVLSRGSGQ